MSFGRLKTERPTAVNMGCMRKTVVKIYDHRALLKLALRDLARTLGVATVTGKFHYIGGLDTEGRPFLRIDLKPFQVPRKRSR
jgi:hypothetical protein